MNRIEDNLRLLLTRTPPYLDEKIYELLTTCAEEIEGMKCEAKDIDDLAGRKLSDDQTIIELVKRSCDKRQNYILTDAANLIRSAVTKTP